MWAFNFASLMIINTNNSNLKFKVLGYDGLTSQLVTILRTRWLQDRYYDSRLPYF